jgi:hypothetical protein
MGSIGMGYYYTTMWGAERDTQEGFPKKIYTPLWTFLQSAPPQIAIITPPGLKLRGLHTGNVNRALARAP